MTKYTILAGLLIACILLLTCGKDKDNIVGSTDHQVESMRTGENAILANGISSTYIVATVYDINGAIADSQKVVFETTHGTIEEYAITDHWGECRVELVSEASDVDLVAEVKATVVRTNVRSLPKTSDAPMMIALRASSSDTTASPLRKLSKPVAAANNTKTILVKFLGITVSVEVEDPVIPADGISTTRATVKLRQTTNQKGISSQEVFLGLNEGKIQSSDYTNYRGDSEVIVTAGKMAMIDTLTVEYGNTLSVSTTVQYVWPILSLTSEYDQVPADGESKIPLMVKLVSHENTPIKGATVKFTTTAGIVEPMATTDRYGIATVNLVAGSEAAAEVNVIARFLELADTVTVAFGSQELSAITLHDDKLPILRDGIATKEITLLATNELEQAVPNALIRLSADVGAVPDSVMTDDAGQATFLFTADAGQQAGQAGAFSGKMKQLSKSAKPSRMEIDRMTAAQARSVDGTATITATNASVQATYQIEMKGITFTLSSDPDSINADGVTTSTIQAIVKETTTNIAVPDHVIGFAADYGTISTTATTNGLGVANMTFVSSDIPGTATITASCGTLFETTPVVMFGDAPTRITLYKNDENPLIRNGADFTLINIVVQDELNQAAGNITIGLSADTGTVPSEITTNATGVAQFAYTADAGETDGIATITARRGDVQSTITVPLLGIAVNVSSEPDSILADGESTALIRVEVKQATSNIALPGQMVVFATENGTIVPTATTDYEGVAQATYTSGATPGLASILVNIGNLQKTAEVFLLNRQPKVIVFDEDIEPVLRDGIATKNVAFTVLDELDQPVAGLKVNLASNVGSVPKYVITDEAGRAQFQFVTDASEEDAVATITAVSGTIQKTFDISLMGLVVEITAVPDTLVADGESTSIIRVAVNQRSTNLAVTNYTIQFATELGTITPGITTDDLGVAVATFTAGVTPGTNSITVIVGKLVKSKEIYLVTDTPNDVVLTVESNFIYVKETGNVEQTQVYATVVGATGQPLKSEIGVIFEVIRGPGGGEYIDPNEGSPLLTSIIKTVNGKATASVRAGTKAGTVQIRATLVDYPDVAAQHTSIVIRSGPPYMWIDPGDPNHVISHTTLMISPGQANVGFVNPLQEVGISVLFGDKYNNPIELGTAVYFTTTGGVIATDAITDASGRAGVVLQNGYPFPNLISPDQNQLAALTIPNPNDPSVPINITINDFEGSEVDNNYPGREDNNGVAVVVAYAWGKDQDGNDVKVWATNQVVFSRAVARFTAETNKTLLLPGEGANISIRVYDVNGNPVAAGSSLTASTNHGEITVPDMIPEAGSWGWGTTYFSTTLVNTYTVEDSTVEIANVKIKLNSVNGTGTIPIDPITLWALPDPPP